MFSLDCVSTTFSKNEMPIEAKHEFRVSVAVSQDKAVKNYSFKEGAKGSKKIMGDDG
jgi:hypothetical protein